MYLFLTPTTNKPLACLTVFKTYGAKNKYIKNFAFLNTLGGCDKIGYTEGYPSG